jgi:hypothetical protein
MLLKFERLGESFPGFNPGGETPLKIASYLNSEISLETAVKELSEVVLNDAENNAEGGLWRLGYSLLRVAGQVPVAHE